MITSQARPLETLYFGGGTPSLVPPELLKRFVDRLDVARDAEVTLERGNHPNRSKSTAEIYQGRRLRFVPFSTK